MENDLHLGFEIVGSLKNKVIKFKMHVTKFTCVPVNNLDFVIFYHLLAYSSFEILLILITRTTPHLPVGI